MPYFPFGPTRVLLCAHGISVTRVALVGVATAGCFPLDLGFFGVVWVSGYFCQ